MARSVVKAFLILVALSLNGVYGARVSSPAHLSVHTAGGVPKKAPWFCHELDCPVFEVMNSTAAYETRYYKAGKWVATNVESYAYALAVSTGFKVSSLLLWGYGVGYTGALRRLADHPLSLAAPL
jgi:hypothetical protein